MKSKPKSCVRRKAWSLGVGWAVALAGWLVLGGECGAGGVAETRTEQGGKHPRCFSYMHDVVSDKPWSIHVVKLDRAQPEFTFQTTLGGSQAFGMATLSEQLKGLPASVGQPLAAINGDFFEKTENYQGRPRDLQVWREQLVTGPSGHTCFWVDPQGTPRMTNVHSRFHVTWPDDRSAPFGLNEERLDDAIVLYTGVIGGSTRTTGGTEFVLESAGVGPWLPLRPGETYEARVREVRNGGDTAVAPGRMVLSVGPRVVPRVGNLSPGAVLKLATWTIPELKGATAAIGGGPTLVRDGKAMQWSGFLHMRHPRSAVGWNKDFIFLVEVDGRQPGLSVGMTFPELAAYLVGLGCEQAMNLDGGGSSTLWALGEVRNSPSEGEERPSANGLVVVRKKPADPLTR